MSDLTDQLRFNAEAGIPDFTNSGLLEKAAERIEALETDLQECLSRLEENTVTMNTAHARIEELEAALRDIIRDIDEYEYNNKLSPSPGKTECWQSVANARAVLDPSRRSETKADKDAGK